MSHPRGLPGTPRAALSSRPIRAPHPLHPEVTRLLARAAQAADLGRRGRHAAAERVLREAASGLDRRGAAGEGAVVRTALAQLLVERGRLAAAVVLLDEAVSATVIAGDPLQQVRATVALAYAWIESERPDRARPLLERLRVLAPHDACVQLVETRLALPGRALTTAVPPAADDALPPFWRAMVEQCAVAALVASGRLADAGRRVRTRLDAWRDDQDPLATAVLRLAHLQVVAATGDLELARPARDEALAWSRRAHAPLRAAEARLLWCAALIDAGLMADARREWRALRRLEPVVTPRLSTAIARLGESRLSHADRATGPTPVEANPLERLPLFVGRVQEATGSEAGVRACLAALVPLLGAASAEVVLSADLPGDRARSEAPSPAVVVRVTPGVTAPWASTRAPGVRPPVRSAGTSDLSPTSPAARTTRRVVGAARLEVRWDADVRPPADLEPLLDVATILLTPVVEAWGRLAAVPALVTGLVGVSEPLVEIRRAIARAARAPFNVLIEGESGVGKELVARAIHAMGPRAASRCCDLNCAALPDDLAEAELFGHARGAFTGAMVDRAGLFEEASGGTLFLDEVAELSPRAQAKLLRVLQQQEVRRLGEAMTRLIDVRVVAAANRDMRAEVAAGRFRADLLYRLDVIHLRIPPLRERPADIPVLAEHFWRAAAERVGTRATLTPGLIERLQGHDWPGNVRELQNVIAALAVSAAPGGRIGPDHLPESFRGESRDSGSFTDHSTGAPDSVASARERFERDYVRQVLARCGGNRTRAARILGLSRQGLLKSLRRLGLAG